MKINQDVKKMLDAILIEMAQSTISYVKLNYNSPMGKVTFEVNNDYEVANWISTKICVPSTTEMVLFHETRDNQIHYGIFDGDLNYITRGEIIDGTNMWLSVDTEDEFNMDVVDYWMCIPILPKDTELRAADDEKQVDKKSTDKVEQKPLYMKIY